MITLIQLQYVLTVAEYKNFTIAAEKAFVSQPTLSMQIQKLEKTLRVELFDRTTNPIKITPIGKKIVEQAKIILSEANKLSQIVEEDKKSMNGTVVIGIIPTITPTLVPFFYKTFRSKYPESDLMIKELKTEDILKGIKEGYLDFGIASTPLHDNQIIEKPIYKEPLVAYVSPHDAKMYKETVLDIDKLDFNYLLMLEEGHCFRDVVLDLCKHREAINSNIKLEGGSFTTLINLVNEGFGFTILPLLESENLSEEEKNNIRYFSSSPSREISLIYSTNQIRTTFADKFVDLIKSILRGKLFLEDKIEHKPQLKVM
ncbi:LysR family transcriptional regulator, hydrogen peroxide-inducible genes activator [Apibacter mensalis]|jgi:LysR family transcriptional regulator, hydrogen peroxide-inducible genes activator|uniref:LysR family transcriptional regulator, hydrogen peroxide-inducible genes activator n=1 Tax=Apibacter mensalis TaxID=1586267 RepID=A0A0X3AQG5_9FLAO|nr:LysR substrate-binding domain-containing protein [Apibacter mensalis]CVK16621.1 LysR family transcriptional regulator, hydrogen peroxide-inducible genes activator [Apibacter mensalis]